MEIYLRVKTNGFDGAASVSIQR